VEQGKAGGRLADQVRADAGMWYLLGAAPTHWLQHSEHEHPASHGTVVTLFT